MALKIDPPIIQWLSDQPEEVRDQNALLLKGVGNERPDLLARQVLQQTRQHEKAMRTLEASLQTAINQRNIAMKRIDVLEKACDFPSLYASDNHLAAKLSQP